MYSFSDNFNRANSAVVDGWTETNSIAWEILSNQVKCTPDFIDSNYTLISNTLLDNNIYTRMLIDFQASNASVTNIYLIFAYLSSSIYAVEFNSSTVQLIHRTPSIYEIFSPPFSNIAPLDNSLRTIEIWRRNNTIFLYEDALSWVIPSSHIAFGVGVRMSDITGSPNVIFDNFSMRITSPNAKKTNKG